VTFNQTETRSHSVAEHSGT